MHGLLNVKPDVIFLLERNTAVHPLTLRLLMSYIYGAPILDVSRFQFLDFSF